METPTLEEVQARHRRELKDLQGRITSKKKNANKKTRKGVNDECAVMERDLKEKQAAELAALSSSTAGGDTAPEVASGEETDDDGSPEAAVEEEPGNKVGRVVSKAEEKMEKAVERLHLGRGSEGGTEAGASSASPSSPQDGAAAAAAAAPGKKRNRQKERLARRRAEQEEAAVRAEQEASTMTDHRAAESASILRTIKSHSLTEHAIAPDGHCLFSAIADQLSHNSIPLTSHGEPAYKTVRRDASAYMLEHRDDFAPFLAADDGDTGVGSNSNSRSNDLEAYATKMRDTAEWGGQLELMALARRYGVEIRVVQDGGRVERIGEEQGLGADEGTGKVLWLAYYRHGYGLGEHYNSLRRSVA